MPVAGLMALFGAMAGAEPVSGRVNDVPDLCAQDSGKRHDGDDGVRIKLDFAPLDLAFKSVISGGKGHNHQQAKGRNFQRPNVYIRKQLKSLQRVKV